jgi:hypothetical protein
MGVIHIRVFQPWITLLQSVDNQAIFPHRVQVWISLLLLQSGLFRKVGSKEQPQVRFTRKRMDENHFYYAEELRVYLNTRLIIFAANAINQWFKGVKFLHKIQS